MMRTTRTNSGPRGGRFRGVGGLARGLPVAVSSLLAGCGFGGSHHKAAVAHAPPKAQAAPQDSPADAALAGMVDAVGPSRNDAPVNLKFRISQKPVVGEDDQIQFAVLPQAHGLKSVRVAFGALEGLKVVSEGPALGAIKPESGVPIFGSMIVRPVKAGLFTLTAAVAVESASQSVMWNFSIPVIAGQGAPRTAADAP
jgi:hypothetical protein